MTGEASRRVIRPSRQQIESMGQEMQDGGERASSARRTPRKIEDQRSSYRATDRAAERSERGVAKAVGAHQLRQPFNETVADQACRLGRDVAWSQAGAAGGDDQVAGDGVLAKRAGDPVYLVGNDLRGWLSDAGLDQKLSYSRPGQIDLLAARTAIADGEHGSAGVGVERRLHEIQSTHPPRGRRYAG